MHARRIHIHPRTIPSGPPATDGDDPVLAWLAGEDEGQADAHLERLCHGAGAVIAQFSTIASFPDPRSLLALLLLDEFAGSRGIDLGELASLAPGSAQSGLRGVDELVRRARECGGARVAR